MVAGGSRLWQTLRLVVSAAAVGILVSRVDLDLMAGLVRTASLGWWFAAVALQPLAVMLAAARWDRLLRTRAVCLPLGLLISKTAEAYPFSLISPAGMGGDLFRAGATAEATGSFATALAIVAADRFVGATALLALGSGLAVSRTGAALIGHQTVELLWITIALFGLGALTILVGGPFLREAALRRRAHRWARILSHVTISAEGVRHLTSCRSLLAAACAGAVFSHVVAMATFWFAARGIGLQLSWQQAMAALVLMFIAQMVPFTIAGLGARESVVAALFASWSLPLAAAVTVSLVWFLIVQTPALAGVYLAVKRRPPANRDVE